MQKKVAPNAKLVDLADGAEIARSMIAPIGSRTLT
jgi:hypothetical protein